MKTFLLIIASIIVLIAPVSLMISDRISEPVSTVTLTPLLSPGEVRVTSNGLEYRMNDSGRWQILFDNHSRVVENTDINDNINLIISDIGNTFLSRNLMNMNGHSHYLVVDNKSRVWHYHFHDGSVADRSYVCTFAGSGYVSDSMDFVNDN